MLEQMYGVAREERKCIREILEKEELINRGRFAHLREQIPIATLYDYDTTAEKIGYIQRDEYFFARTMPKPIVDVIYRILEGITPSYDCPPEEVHRIRRGVMDYLNSLKIGEGHYKGSSIDGKNKQPGRTHPRRAAKVIREIIEQTRSQEKLENVNACLEDIAYALEGKINLSRGVQLKRLRAVC